MEAKMNGGNQSPTTKQGGEYEDMVMMGNGNEVSTTRAGDYRKNGNMMSKADEASASKTEKDVVIKISSGSDGHGPSIYQSTEEEFIVNIPRVPDALRRGDKDVYEPKVISFGPYHRGNHRLQPMEKLKRENLQRILNKREYRLSYYLDKIGPMENRVRSCYSDDINLLSRDFVEMMLLDSCFMIHFMRGTDLPIPDDKIWMWELIYNDMLKLENQLPLFLVEYVYHLIKDEHQRQDFIENALEFFSVVNNREKPDTARFSRRGVRHLFHLFHKFLFFEEEGCKSTAPAKRPISGANSLEERGIKFRPMESTKVMDVKFIDGTMEIAPLCINASNISLFKNLIAFERFDPYTEPFFTGYAEFMDYIIDTSKDVALLRKNGIITRAFGSDEEIATIFNQLTSRALDYQPTKMISIYKDVEKYCQKEHKHWMAIFLRDYWSNPWTKSKVIAAIILLVLAFTQTFFTIYSCFK